MNEASVPEQMDGAHKSGGLQSLLAVPFIYELLQKVLGGHRARRQVVSDHIRPQAGLRILDIGCGTGQIITYLPAVAYIGFDLSPIYIDAAQRRFGDRGEFQRGDVTQMVLPEGHAFDRVLALGVLHHLDDTAVVALLRLARKVLAVDGRLITLDPLATVAQTWLGRQLVRWERGRHVRSVAATQALFEVVFEQSRATTYPRLLGYTYHHLVMETGPISPNVN